MANDVESKDRTPGRRLVRGYVQLYTGDGKGKTTAALGLALRASGSGLRTYIGQFMKGQACGETRALRDHSKRFKHAAVGLEEVRVRRVVRRETQGDRYRRAAGKQRF